MNKFFLFMTIFFIKTVSAQETKVLKFCYEPIEQFPYYMGNSNKTQDPPGVSIDLINLVAKKLKFKAEFHRRPWKRCLFELKNGVVDGIFNGSFKESRLKVGRYPFTKGSIDSTKRITTLSYNFYTNKNSDFTWDGKKISGNSQKVIAPLGYSIVDNLNKLNNIVVIEKGTTVQHLKMLYENKVDAIAAQKVTADKLISKNNRYKNIKIIEEPIKIKDYFLLLSHQLVEKEETLAKKIWKTLGEYRKSHLKKLLQSY